jgi:NAD(P)-dependent dehydrogenase (short-subunit alcohol dehydrogenase family)
MDLQGKVVLVTGGARRVGRIVAEGLAARGASVAISYRTSHKEARHVAAMAVQVDQRNTAQVRAAVQKIEKALGPIDVLINNASSFYPVSLEKTTPAIWRDLIDSNLSGPFWFSQAVGPKMKKRGRGKIINMIDVSVESPWVDHLAYSAAKGGLATLTKGLAKALAPAVQVNGISPGPILFPAGISAAEKTKLLEKTLLKRVGSPDDILRAVLYLIEADFVTGTIMPVDGGRLLA